MSTLSVDGLSREVLAMSLCACYKQMKASGTDILHAQLCACALARRWMVIHLVHASTLSMAPPTMGMPGRCLAMPLLPLAWSL
eukprot:44040-Eustigmatos_ZCMA.PRE.1